VLLLHGQPGGAGDWDPVADLLVADHRVIVPDRPGYGDSPGPASGPAGNADVMARLLDRLGASPATVAGHSYGATVALRLAELHPEAVSALVLVCPAGVPRALSVGDRLLALPLAGEVLARAAMRGAARVLTRLSPEGPDLALGPAAALPRARLGAYAARWRTGEDWRSFAVEQRALVTEMAAVAGALPEVGVPVTVLAGRRDHLVPPSAIPPLAAALADCSVVWVPTGGHLLVWEEPELVAASVARAARGAA
jgi:pimeloyl-ACP methyl ester carboxylesterase